jgi:hypothetical protein
MSGLFYLSFHGGKSHKDINDICVYTSDGQPASPATLPLPASPQLEELRSFAFLQNGVFVVNGYKKFSQLLQYVPSGSSYTCTTWADLTINSVDHPFDFAFDANGNCYLSSQDTGVVTILTGPKQTGAVPAALTASGIPASSYLQGTFVASTSDDLPNLATNASVAVAEPLGLNVSISDGKVANSVRGLAYWNGALLVADEVGGLVKAYSTADGSVLAAVTGLASPVHLLINNSTLYISTGQGVMQVALPQQITFTTPLNAEPYIDAAMLTAAKAASVAGMCFAPISGATSAMYVADRKGKAVYYLDTTGKLKPFITGLTDSPEFIVYQ